MAHHLGDEGSSRSLMEQIVLGVAHELNNPNTFIRVNSMNLKKMLALLAPCFDEFAQNHPDQKFGPYTIDELRSKMVKLTESTLEATIRIISIADKLKQSVSMAMGESSEISLNKVINNIVTSHQFLIQKLGQLKWEQSEVEDFKIKGHELQLEQAFSILFTNAYDALCERYKNEMADSFIEMKLRKNEDRVEFIFTDNGCGMSEKTLAKIFDPFFTTKPQGVGDGLGLALCRSIIERHGGNISATSAVGEGTQFTISLPQIE